jgi:hypothetical protein
MSYKSEQYNKAVEFKASLKDNEEDKYFLTINGKKYQHFFRKRQLNLWEDIRANALEYFSAKNIHWHTNDVENNPETIPEGDMLSSQISCVNHLLLLRKNQYYANAILKNIDKRIVSAEIVRDGYGDDGYVEFESWGTKENNNPLNEKECGTLHGKRWRRERGAFSTSVDSIMVGKKDDGRNILVLIEWKFTEDYTKDYDGKKYKGKTSNRKEYDKLLMDRESPIIQIDNFDDLYYDPFYQLMRQTLLGWKAAKDYYCDEYIHLHIIPDENLQIQEITSPNLISKGSNMSNVWENLLKEPFRYKMLSPEKLLSPLKDNQNLKGFFDYLMKRYLDKYM